MQCKVVKSAVGEPIAVILSKNVSECVTEGGWQGNLQLAFLTRAIRLTLAKLDMLRWTALLPRSFEIRAIRGVGTTS